MPKASVSPKTVTVGSKTYRIVKVSRPQNGGRADWLDSDQAIDTFKGERVAVLKPV